MNNADKPINPVEVDVADDGKVYGIQTGNNSGFELGLTKREYFAGLAMQGLISSTDWNESIANEQFIASTAKESVSFADALLKQLETTQD